MYGIITALIVIACILLILVVLIQNPKGGGIASNFSAGNNIMGVKKTNDFIEKLTWGLAIGIIVLTLTSGMFLTKTVSDETPNSRMKEQIDNAPDAAVPPQQTAPAQPQEVPGE